MDDALVDENSDRRNLTKTNGQIAERSEEKKRGKALGVDGVERMVVTIQTDGRYRCLALNPAQPASSTIP